MTWTREDLRKRNDDQVASIADKTLNRLAKWRSVFAGWQLGTRVDTDPECRAVRDHREMSMLTRVEMNALTRLLIDAGVFTARGFTEQVIVEAEAFAQQLEDRFPGFTATDIGMSMKLPEAADTMKGWRP